MFDSLSLRKLLPRMALVVMPNSATINGYDHSLFPNCNLKWLSFLLELLSPLLLVPVSVPGAAGESALFDTVASWEFVRALRTVALIMPGLATSVTIPNISFIPLGFRGGLYHLRP